MKHRNAWILIALFGCMPVACVTDGTDETEDPDSITAKDGGEEDGKEDGEEDGGEEGGSEEDGGGDDQTLTTDGVDGEADGEDGEDGTIEEFPNEIPDPVDDPAAPTAFQDTPENPMTDAPQQPKPSGATWTPNNDNVAPTPVSQGDLTMTCQPMGPGVNAGFTRFGCKALRADGQHYGIVKGWWRILRADGIRAKTKDLNFREAGYDMTFDVYGPDATQGIRLQPGAGEAKPRTCPGQMACTQ